MKTITKKENYSIIHSKKNKEIKKIEKGIKDAILKNKKLFKINPPKIRIELCDSEEDYKKTARTQGPAGGSVKNGKIITMTPSKRLKNTLETKDSLYHEINHLFFMDITRHGKPIWLAEGLTFINQNYYTPSEGWKDYLRNINNLEKRYLPVKANHLRGTDERSKFYILCYFCINYLQKKNGTNKIINFLNKIPNPYNDKKFWKVFKKEFKLTKKELIKEALK